MVFLLQIFILSLSSPSYSLDADFFRHQKAEEKRDLERNKGAYKATKIRKKNIAARKKKAKSYGRIRKKQEKKQDERERLYKGDAKKRDLEKIRSEKAASRYAKKKRKKSESTWEDQNIEYGIKKPNKIMKKGE